MQVLADNGYSDRRVVARTGDYTYCFSGLSGSLDHVLANSAGAERW